MFFSVILHTFNVIFVNNMCINTMYKCPNYADYLSDEESSHVLSIVEDDLSAFTRLNREPFLDSLSRDFSLYGSLKLFLFSLVSC